MSIEEKASKANGGSASKPWVFKKFDESRWAPILHVFGLATQAMSWYIIFARDKPLASPRFIIFSVVFAFVLAAQGTFGTAYLARVPDGSRIFRIGLAAVAINSFMTITMAFAALYWFIGTAANFNVELSRVDAIYFSLGTLTTAGTGTIAPTSDLARTLVSGQMIVDLVFIAGALTIAISRWSEKLSS